MSLFRPREARAAQVDPVVEAIQSRARGWSAVAATPESAARKVAVGSSIRLLTAIGATMPWDAYRRTDGVQREITPTPAIVGDPEGQGRGVADFVAQTIWSLAARGNYFWRVPARNPTTALPTVLSVLHPDAIWPLVDAEGTLRWRVPKGRPLESHEVIHARLFPVPGQVLGLSPIEQHAATIGLGIAAEKFGADYFTAGGHPTVALETDAPLKTEEAREVKDRYVEGSADRTVIVLPGGIKANRIQVAPNESQFLDAQGYSSAECARIFGPGIAEVLGYETGGSMTYTNVQDRDLHLLKYAAQQYLRLVEQGLTGVLPRPQYVKANRDALLATSTIDRLRAYEIEARIGIATPNEQREREDRPPVDWGDQPYNVKTPAAAAPSSEGATP